MKWGYCSIHGRFADDRGYGCRRCQNVESERVEGAARLEEAIRRAQLFEANPGEYGCPECRFITLRRGASRCPKCHASVPSGYWTPIFEREEREAAEEKQRRKLADAADAQKKQREDAIFKRQDAIVKASYFFIGLGCILGWFLGLVTATGHMPPVSWGGEWRPFVAVLLWPLFSLLALIELFANPETGGGVGWFVGLFTSIVICILKLKYQKSK